MKILGRDQPWSILLLVAVLLLGACGGIIAAIALAAFGSFVTIFIPMIGAFMGVAALLVFLVALAYLTLAYGLLVHNVLAWWIVFIFADISLLGAIVSLFTLGFGGLISLAIAVCFAAIMLHRDTISAIDPLKAIDVDWSGWSFED